MLEIADEGRWSQRQIDKKGFICAIYVCEKRQVKFNSVTKLSLLNCAIIFACLSKCQNNEKDVTMSHQKRVFSLTALVEGGGG